MVALTNFFDAIRGFIELGGNVLWAIMAVLLMMWTLIIERYWYFFRVSAGKAQDIPGRVAGARDSRSWYAGRIKEELVSRLSWK
jgi:biopolymer transport protein ExbB